MTGASRSVQSADRYFEPASASAAASSSWPRGPATSLTPKRAAKASPRAAAIRGGSVRPSSARPPPHILDALRALTGTRTDRIGQPETRRQLVDAGLDQDASMLKKPPTTPHLGAPHQLAPPEQDLGGRGAVEAHGPVLRRAACGGLRSERRRDAQPVQSILQGKAEPVVGG